MLVWEPESVLEFSWITETGLATRVRYEIKPDGTESLLDVRHAAMSTAGAPHYAAGWHAMLDHLAARLAGSEFDWDRSFEDVHGDYVAAFGDSAQIPGSDAEPRTPAEFEAAVARAWQPVPTRD